MIKYKLKLDIEEKTDDDISTAIIDISSISPHGSELSITFDKTTLPIEVSPDDFIKFTLIGKHISNMVSREIELAIIEKNNRDQEIEKDVLDTEIIESDEERVSELDLIHKILNQYHIHSPLTSVITSGKSLTPKEISEFTYIYLDKIIVQGPKKAGEFLFENMSDLEYTLWFLNGSVKIKRENNEFSIEDTREMENQP